LARPPVLAWLRQRAVVGHFQKERSSGRRLPRLHRVVGESELRGLRHRLPPLPRVVDRDRASFRLLQRRSGSPVDDRATTRHVAARRDTPRIHQSQTAC
jgi:hypothetical protein